MSHVRARGGGDTLNTALCRYISTFTYPVIPKRKSECKADVAVQGLEWENKGKFREGP